MNQTLIGRRPHQKPGWDGPLRRLDLDGIVVDAPAGIWKCDKEIVAEITCRFGDQGRLQILKKELGY